MSYFDGLYVEAEEGEQGYGLVVRPASDSDLLAAVRRGVESGTIEGEVEWVCREEDAVFECESLEDAKERRVLHGEHYECGTYLVIPVDGEETP